MQINSKYLFSTQNLTSAEEVYFINIIIFLKECFQPVSTFIFCFLYVFKGHKSPQKCALNQEYWQGNFSRKMRRFHFCEKLDGHRKSWTFWNFDSKDSELQSYGSKFLDRLNKSWFYLFYNSHLVYLADKWCRSLLDFAVGAGNFCAFKIENVRSARKCSISSKIVHIPLRF